MGFSKIWVHGEASDGAVASITLELLAKARELADTVEVVVAGDADSVAAELGDHGASVVYSIGPLDGGLAGPRIASAIAEACSQGSGPDVMLCGTTYDGRDVAGRLSAKLDTPVITNVIDLKQDGKLLQFGQQETVLLARLNKPLLPGKKTKLITQPRYLLTRK